MSQTYVPPIGIPAPEFGINETVENIYGEGYFTHYIDNSDPNANNDNGNGTPEAPQSDIFLGGNTLTLPAGSVVEIHGGPYDHHSWRKIYASGTAEQPVIIRGADPENPIVFAANDGASDWRLDNCSYLIIENIKFADGAHIRFRTETDTSHHVSIRNVEIVGTPGVFHPIGAAIGGSADYVVVFNCEIHGIWKGLDLDTHGVTPGNGSNNWWILENDIYDLSGDGVQALHNATNAPRFVYIGKNKLHECRENAVDIKEIFDVVISQNEMWGFGPTEVIGNGSDGTALVVNNQSDYPKERVWILYNEIHNSVNGIRSQDNAYVIGNIVYSCTGRGLISWQAQEMYVVGNTFVDLNIGIEMANWSGGDRRMDIYNNIIVDADTAIMNKMASVAAASSLTNNLIWNSGSPFLIQWAGSNYNISSTDGFSDIPNAGDNCIVGNPLFVDADSNDYQVLSSSPAIDAGTTVSVYDTFFDLYGIDIKVDYDGKTRPFGSAWDIGAFEFDDGTTSLNTGRNVVIPNKYDLVNYPNPFNPATVIQYSIPVVAARRASSSASTGSALKLSTSSAEGLAQNPVEERLVTLKIHDVLGRELSTLVNEHQRPGNYEVRFNGSSLSSGMYLYTLTAGNFTLTKKMILMK